MPRDRAVKGDRPPAWPSKATLAAELDVSESTIDEWVRRGILPKPVRMAGSVRWCWDDVNAALSAGRNSSEDPFMSGVQNVS